MSDPARNPLSLGSIFTALVAVLFFLCSGISVWALNETVSLRDRTTKIEAQFTDIIRRLDENREDHKRIEDLLRAVKP